MSGATSRRVLLAVVFNAGSFSGGALLACLALLLLSDEFLGLADQFLFLLAFPAVCQITLLFFAIVGIFDDRARVRDEFHGEAEGKLQVPLVDALLGGDAVLDLFDQLLKIVDFENLHIILVEEAVTRAFNRDDEDAGRLVILDVGWARNLKVLLQVLNGGNTSGVETYL